MPHIHEKIDFCSEVYVVNGDAVLLRKHDKYKTFMPPGGHIELHEDMEEAALREVLEEVGMVVQLVGERAPSFDDEEKEVLVPRFINRHYVNDTHEHIASVYFATSDSREVTQGETEISDEIRWFTREELDDPSYEIWDRIKYYAKAALDTLAR